MKDSAPKQAIQPIASWRHLAIVVAILIAVTIRGLMFYHAPAGNGAASAHASTVYLSLIAMESALVYLVWRGIRVTGTTLRSLIGGRWSSPLDIARDVALGIVLWMCLLGIARLSAQLAGGDRLPTSVAAMLPRTAAEITLWIILSVVGGTAEEIVFRGYLQRQFETLTHNRWIALAIQAILFGVSHGYQGAGAMARITLLGAAFGLMAVWRRSLRPGIIAHAWTDIASGIFRPG